MAAERAAYRDETAGLDPAGLIFVDESGVTTRMTRTHARAPRGERARGSVPCGGWRRVTLLGALALDGPVAMMSVEAAPSTPVFLAFLVSAGVAIGGIGCALAVPARTAPG